MYKNYVVLSLLTPFFYNPLCHATSVCSSTITSKTYFRSSEVRVYDFVDKKLGKSIPYGVYDIQNNTGWVSVGLDHDTAQFAVQTIRQWWNQMGQKVYPNAQGLMITADGGGSNGSRCKLWKYELQHFSDESGLEISVSHFPPGTSKWNKIEHRMFSCITQNWRERPLLSYEVIVNLIANTRTNKGLTIQAEIDNGFYPKGIKLNREQIEEINLCATEFHGQDWNYMIKPKQRKC